MINDTKKPDPTIDPMRVLAWISWSLLNCDSFLSELVLRNLIGLEEVDKIGPVKHPREYTDRHYMTSLAIYLCMVRATGPFAFTFTPQWVRAFCIAFWEEHEAFVSVSAARAKEDSDPETFAIVEGLEREVGLIRYNFTEGNHSWFRYDPPIPDEAPRDNMRRLSARRGL